MADVLDLKKLITFHPDKIYREMLSDKPEMRIALMCLKAGQKLDPHKAPLRLLIYCVEGKGTFTVGDEENRGRRKDVHPLRSHGASWFCSGRGDNLVVMGVVTPVEVNPCRYMRHPERVGVHVAKRFCRRLPVS
ncbi:MAG: hypothetical protein M0C28_16845 [Candidatus Moduliflexus flocculans]|nr:hypothetical protein [Candidatus Moduliflexus flocculans]